MADSTDPQPETLLGYNKDRFHSILLSDPVGRVIIKTLRQFPYIILIPPE